MLLMLKKTIQTPLYVLGLVIAITLVNFSTGAKYEFDWCETHVKSAGICRVLQECQYLIDDVKSDLISIYDPIHCGFKGNSELVCCPIARAVYHPKSGLPNQPLDFGSIESTLTDTPITRKKYNSDFYFPTRNDDLTNRFEPKEFDACESHDKSAGICRVPQDCLSFQDTIRSGVPSFDLIYCSFRGTYELVCCPEARVVSQSKRPFRQPSQFGSNAIQTATKTLKKKKTSTGDFHFPIVKPTRRSISITSTTTKTPKRSTSGLDSPIIQPVQFNAVRTDRPAVEACRIIQADLGNVLTPHVLGGTAVNPGEYPHMVAIGYATGIEEQPYIFFCGGTLIHERFVLTAAHCMNNPNFVPDIVRLGMSNFDDAEELVNKYEVPIKSNNVHIHPQFSQLNKLHDIALIEFEKPIPKNKYISPTCLYTDSKDPSAEDMLYVAGWGVYNYTSTLTSNALLKTRMYLVSDDFCRDSYRVQGITLQSEHMCATDPKNSADACWGDSGGPLLLHVDESILDFRLVGIIAAGYGCAGSIPGLYMRVSMYLDWIENIVWPSN